ncbi:hypothetical protein LCGC14_0811070 [marine sediment metagenome]|uniref:Uncharacterized protein n=1 Tax=marine sediment metagenome TaxID=412755 RepID=A0A0F9S6P4_9ZZZZ
MSDAESIQEDAKRERYLEHIVPEPCGCVLLSECCSALPHEASPDVSKDNPAGICGACRDNVGFESSDEQTWVQIGSDTYGADADGRRGVPLRTFRCTECHEEEEVTYA